MSSIRLNASHRSYLCMLAANTIKVNEPEIILYGEDIQMGKEELKLAEKEDE